MNAFGYTGGDDWEFRFTLIHDDTELPYDLSGNPVLMWTLIGPGGKIVIAPSEVNYVIVDALAGRCSVQVPAAMTSRVTNGLHTHALRVVHGGVINTPYVGMLNAMSDPWNTSTATVVARKFKLVS